MYTYIIHLHALHTTIVNDTSLCAYISIYSIYVCVCISLYSSPKKKERSETWEYVVNISSTTIWKHFSICLEVALYINTHIYIHIKCICMCPCRCIRILYIYIIMYVYVYKIYVYNYMWHVYLSMLDMHVQIYDNYVCSILLSHSKCQDQTHTYTWVLHFRIAEAGKLILEPAETDLWEHHLLLGRSLFKWVGPWGRLQISSSRFIQNQNGYVQKRSSPKMQPSKPHVLY